jgi:hypothetical protein
MNYDVKHAMNDDRAVLENVHFHSIRQSCVKRLPRDERCDEQRHELHYSLHLQLDERSSYKDNQ